MPLGGLRIGRFYQEAITASLPLVTCSRVGMDGGPRKFTIPPHPDPPGYSASSSRARRLISSIACLAAMESG